MQYTRTQLWCLLGAFACPGFGYFLLEATIMPVIFAYGFIGAGVVFLIIIPFLSWEERDNFKDNFKPTGPTRTYGQRR